MKRAIRRYHRYRLLTQRKNYHWSHRHWGTQPRERVVTYVKTPTPCSCWGCGNQRRAFGRTSLTLAEQRFNCKTELDW